MGLGRSFESLIPTDLLDESFDPTAAQDDQVSELRHIKMTEIVTDPDQPRRQFDNESLEELADSIREHGILQPIVVTPHAGGYQIVAGERRYRASKMAGKDRIPALVRTLTGQHKLELSLIENLQRKDLNIIETATAYQKLRDQFNLNLDDIGKRVGNKSVSAVSNTLRLLKLPKVAVDALASGKLSEGQARPLIGLDIALITKLLPRIMSEEWTARKTEQYIVDLKNDGLEKSRTLPKQALSKYQADIDRLAGSLNTKISVHTNTKGAGQIVIAFKNEKEFRRINSILGTSK